MRNFAILIWVFFISDALSQGLNVPYSSFGQDIPVRFTLSIMLFPFLFFSLVPFLLRKGSRDNFVVKLIEKLFGIGTTDKLVSAIKPYWLFMAACFTLGSTGLLSTYLSSQSFSGYLISGYFISAGFGLLVSYLLSVKFPPRVA